MEIFIFWLLFSIVVGIAASSRGRSGFLWFLLAAIISPLLAIILVLVLPNKSHQPQATQYATGEQPTPETHVRCPECRELVRMDASKCKHCGTKLVPQKVSAT